MNDEPQYFFSCFYPFRLDGLDWKYSIFHLFSQQSRSKKKISGHSSRASNCAWSHCRLQPFWNLYPQFFKPSVRHHSNCRRHSSFPDLSQNGFSSCQKHRGQLSPRDRTIYRTSCYPPNCRAGSSLISHDLYAANPKPSFHDRRDFSSLGRIFDHSSLVPDSAALFGMERNFSSRAPYGSDFNADCSRDVSARTPCIQLTLAYDGTNYFGWQKTASGPTIQQALENAFEKLTQTKVSLDAVSRTDRGVHAEAQIVQFAAQLNIPIEKLPLALNAHLPKDIRVKSAKTAPDFFRPSSKTYRYTLTTGYVQSPFIKKYSWHYPYPLDLDLMQEGADFLIGEHDFSSFTTIEALDPYRTIFSIKLTQIESGLEIRMTGDRFLYKMARTIAGTLANLASHKISLENFKKTLSGKRRALAGVTAPSLGLCLEKIDGI